jgi:hypothetical protein
MDIGFQECSERIVHQTVPLHQRFAGKLLRHDSNVKVPLTTPTNMTSVGGTVVANLELHGMQSILHYRADSFNPRRRGY